MFSKCKLPVQARAGQGCWASAPRVQWGPKGVPLIYQTGQACQVRSGHAASEGSGLTQCQYAQDDHHLLLIKDLEGGGATSQTKKQFQMRGDPNCIADWRPDAEPMELCGYVDTEILSKLATVAIASSASHDYTYAIVTLIMTSTDTLYGNRSKP